MHHYNLKGRNWKNKLVGNIFFCLVLLRGILFPLFFSIQVLYSQTGGLKYINNYHTAMHSLNWGIIQDQRGIIYIANNGCVLEYDGESQRILNIPNWSVRSMATDDEGTLYVGGINEFGYFALDSKGMRHYVTLLDYLKGYPSNFSLVFQINTTKNGVYFRTKRFLFRWQPSTKKMEVLEPEIQFDVSFTCNGILLVQQKDVGLMQMVDNSFEIINGSEIFASAKIKMIALYKKGSPKVLIGTQSMGFYIYDGQKVMPFPTEVDDYIRENQLYHGIRLTSSASSGDFALATLRGGLIIIDSYGKLKRIFNRSSGLQDDNVKYVFEDVQGNLWLALDNGISKIEYTSPFSFFNDKLTDLQGAVLSITRFTPDNALLAGTSRGLYLLESSEGLIRSNRFQPVPGIKNMCWDLLAVDNFLLVASSDGVFRLGKDLTIKGMVVKFPSYVLHCSETDSNRVLVGTRTGLISLHREGHKWIEESCFKNIKEDIRTIIEEKNGNLWLGTLANGAIKVDVTETGKNLHPVVTRYNNSHGLPGGEVRVFKISGQVIFVAGRKLYRFNDMNRNFSPYCNLGKEFTDSSMSVFTLAEDKRQNIWFHSEFQNFQAIPREDKSFLINEKPFLRIPKFQINSIYPDPINDIIWFGGQNGLIAYNIQVRRNYNQPFPVFIREVIVNGIPLMYDEKNARYKTDNNRGKGTLKIPYRERNLIFKFAAPFFEDEDSNVYRCILENYEKEWSEWDSDAKKVYTNLDSGFYTFRVQAKNVYNHLSEEDLFRFRILPPWYKTWWAFTVYVLVTLLSTIMLVKWRSRQLERENKRLEQTVEERTREINEKSIQLEQQTIQLTEQSEQLKEMDQIKSRFFANISHEFRTPLTLIMGPLEQMLANSSCKEQHNNLHMMLRNSKRLLHLINQLLDLSKLDSGNMKLRASLQDIIPFLKGIISSFEVMARQNWLELPFSTSDQAIFLYFDVEKLETVMTNLLVNAIKFTPSGGKISVKVEKKTGEKIQKENINHSKKKGIVEILVCDTGIGIPEDQMHHIFDRFFQAGSQLIYNKSVRSTVKKESRDLPGTGIGLALVKELVELHHGSIDVKSSVGEKSGTTFIIRLPLDKDHLEPCEVATSVEIPYGKKTGGLLSAFVDEVIENNEKSIDKDDGESPGNSNQSEKDIILIVEDNKDARQFIRSALEPYYAVKEAVNGQDGIEKAKKIIPDLIVSDIMMPGLDGYELCNHLKNDIKTSHIPIILLTAKASEPSIIQGLEHGADDFITKPFSTRILMARIKNLIELRRLWQHKILKDLSLEPFELKVSSMDQKFLKEVQEIIEKNLSDEFFNVNKLGKKLYMSRTTLYRKILALTSQTPREFIKSYRLKRGAQLLKANFGNVTEVAFEVGFSSTTYFSKCFKEQFHQLPSAYQNEEKEKTLSSRNSKITP